MKLGSKFTKRLTKPNLLIYVMKTNKKNCYIGMCNNSFCVYKCQKNLYLMIFYINSIFDYCFLERYCIQTNKTSTTWTGMPRINNSQRLSSNHCKQMEAINVQINIVERTKPYVML